MKGGGLKGVLICGRRRTGQDKIEKVEESERRGGWAGKKWEVGKESWAWSGDA